jgi:hypothetical protein
MKTRSYTRSRKQLYASRLKSSQCRGKTSYTCRLRNGCKRTLKGRRKSYCRRRKNLSSKNLSA